MAGTKVIKVALATLEVTSNAALLPQRIEIAVAASNQFVGIGLVAHIPHHTITVEIERLIKSKREFNDTETRTKMASAVGNNLKVTLTDLCRDILKLGCAEAMQLIGMRQIAQVHGLSTDLVNLRALPALCGSVRLPN